MNRLPNIPTPSQKRIAVRVTRDAVRQIRGGHPWVYDGSITSLSHEARPGDLAVIFNSDRSFLAIGLYDPASPIRIKVLHQGKPAKIDQDFWIDRLRSANKLRAELNRSAQTTGYRCVNGENDRLPGLVLDRYDSSYVLKVYSEAWLPHLQQIREAIAEVFNPEVLILRMSRSTQAGEIYGLYEGQALIGDAPAAPVPFKENGLSFEANILSGQKTGHFLDQRDNRRLVGDLANRASVLDLFSCTGGFSVYAAAGGAASVTSVDQSPQALETAKANMALNKNVAAISEVEHQVMRGDVFDVLGSFPAQQRFDIVVVDPPSFAPKKESISVGIRSYRRLTEAAIAVLEPGGLLVQASCSSRISEDEFVGAVEKGAANCGRKFDIINRTGHAVDHPVTFAHGSYLKAIFARVG